MWSSGDNFEYDAKTGSQAISPAINLVSPSHVVINDWHYWTAPTTADYFANKGFDVVSVPWQSWSSAQGQLNEQLDTSNASIAPHLKGIMQSTWVSATDFMYAYKYGQDVNCNNYDCTSNSQSTQFCADGYCFSALSYHLAETFKLLMSHIRSST